MMLFLEPPVFSSLIPLQGECFVADFASENKIKMLRATGPERALDSSISLKGRRCGLVVREMCDVTRFRQLVVVFQLVIKCSGGYD